MLTESSWMAPSRSSTSIGSASVVSPTSCARRAKTRASSADRLARMAVQDSGKYPSMPFDFAIDEAMARVREAVKPFPRAMLFELYDAGHRSAFEILVARLISVRTRDETSLPMARRLFARARTPREMAELDINDIDALIDKCAFHLVKAEQIHTIPDLTAKET